MGKYLLWWGIIWALIGGVVYAFVGKETPDVIYGIALAAFISLVFLFKMLAEQYEGVITEVKEESRYVSDDDGGSVQKTLYAYILMSNGKTKKVQAAPGYIVGNYIVKKKGEPSPKIYNKKPE